ncbi:Uncharacterized protein BWINRASL_00337 [Bacillus mycoides]|nr:hypothetical protein IEQ_00246 [Bacillus cereus BAG6X1-2]SCM91838.1 Uncharacterized protein BWINRASL_00337 [Bacillus mycoides]
MAKKSNSAKEEILIESFNVLKDNIEKNGSKLMDIIGKISKFNLDLSVEMWKYIIKNAQNLMKENGYRYTSGVIYAIKQKTSVSTPIEILKNEEEILEACFGLSSDISNYTIAEMIELGEMELADKALELLKSNKNKEESFGSYLEEICESFVDTFEDIETFDEDWDDKEEYDQKVAIASEGSTVLLKWVKTIKDKEQRARLNVTLIDYV